MDINNEAAMRMLTKMALERAMQTLSEQARMAAEACPDGMSGRDALLAFSRAILSTNEKVWPRDTVS